MRLNQHTMLTGRLTMPTRRLTVKAIVPDGSRSAPILSKDRRDLF